MLQPPPPHTPEGVNNNDKPKFSEIRLFAIDFAWEVRRDTNILGPSRFEKIGPKFSLLSLATASPAAPLAAARTLRHPTTSHPVASPLPLEPLHPIPWCWSGRGRGSRSPNSRRGAGNPAGNRVPDSGTCARVRSCGKLVLLAPKSCRPSYLGTVTFQHGH